MAWHISDTRCAKVYSIPLCAHLNKYAIIYIYIYIYIYMCVCVFVVNSDSLAQASDIAIFVSKGDKLSSSAECRIRTWKSQTFIYSPADWMPTHKPTELSRIKQKLELNSSSLWWVSIQPTWLHRQLVFAPGSLRRFGSNPGLDRGKQRSSFQFEITPLCPRTISYIYLYTHIYICGVGALETFQRMGKIFCVQFQRYLI